MKKVIIPIAILALIIFVACNNDNVAPIEETTVEEVVVPAIEVIKEEKEAPVEEVPEINNNTTE